MQSNGPLMQSKGPLLQPMLDRFRRETEKSKLETFNLAPETMRVDCLEDHRRTVHTYESFGRSIAELMIQEARRILLAQEGETSSAAIEFKADVTVSAIGPTGCLGVEICVPMAGCSKVHVTLG